MENLIQDLKHGFRLLSRRPGFTAVAVASLALGVGLNTTLFSVVNAVLLRHTVVHEPGRLAEIYSSVSDDFPYMRTAICSRRWSSSSATSTGWNACRRRR